MATADQYADWIVRNKDKKGTKEFETVAAAYKLAKQEESETPTGKPSELAAAAVPRPVAAEPSEIPARRQPRGFFERMAGVGPSVGLVDVTIPSRLTREQLEQSAREQAATGLGLVAGPVLAAGSRMLGAAIPAIQRFTAPLATAFETGGFRTGLPTTTPATARVATRIVGAAAPGAIGGLPVDEAGTGATVSTGIALLAPPVASIVAKGGGYIADALQGKVATARANELLRETIGDEVNALKQAVRRTQIPYRGAEPDIPPSRIAAQLNLPALSALIAKAEELSPSGVVNAFRQKETQDTINELARLAGGPTAETARAARETAKESLGEITGRLREEALGAARRTGEVMPRLQTIATEARAEVQKNVDFVRRISTAINEAEDWATNWVSQRGIGEAGVRLPERAVATVTYPGQLAASGRQVTRGGPFEREVIEEGGVIAQRIEQAAQASREAGARARVAENTYQSMVDRDLQPITLDKFTVPIDRLLAEPSVSTNPILSKALPQVRQMFEDWTNQYGIITPEALEAIRKNGISGIIQQLMPGIDAKQQNRVAAQVLTKLRPAIDEAIEKAGGTNWKNYLASFERGMSDIRNMELADQIRKWYQSGKAADRKKIVDLLAGESPDVVEDFFGSGRYKIAKEMAKDIPLLERIGNAVQLDIKAAAQAKVGRKPLAEIVEKRSAKLRFPFFTRASTAVNEVIQAIEQKVGRQTMDEIVKAAQSGRDFNALLNALPTRERSAFLAQFKNSESWSKFSTQVANAARAYAVSQTGEQTNALAPENQNALRQ